MCGFIALYWGARIVIQFGFYRKHAPPGAFYRFAEAAFVLLFFFLTGVYGAAAVA